MNGWVVVVLALGLPAVLGGLIGWALARALSGRQDAAAEARQNAGSRAARRRG